SRSQVSSQRQVGLTENLTRMSEPSNVLHQTLGELSTQADLLENIWKLENIFQNHSNWLQRLEIRIKIQISNITEDTSSLWVTHIQTEAQLRNEMEILSTVTEDLRLKDWEHSMTLKNLTILEGDRDDMNVDSGY
ncbi:hypothetical protein GOODEAATRI_018669, partial [Goodea atripinnis]